MKTTKIKIHFLDEYLRHPTNPIRINLVGAGGTGSFVLSCLARMNETLIAFGHPGIMLRLWDDDLVSIANKARQLFSDSEVGLPKATVLINRVNRAFGTNWKAERSRFPVKNEVCHSEEMKASIYVSCVDNVTSRLAISEWFTQLGVGYSSDMNPKYWLDFGNSKDSGQVILGTIGHIKQPKSNKYEPYPCLPDVVQEFGELMKAVEEKDDTPSCSLIEAVRKQSLFINSTLAQLGCDLLNDLLTEGMIGYRGIYLNLKSKKSQGIRVGV